jgi:hypothetical protein
LFLAEQRLTVNGLTYLLLKLNLNSWGSGWIGGTSKFGILLQGESTISSENDGSVSLKGNVRQIWRYGVLEPEIGAESRLT